MICSANQLTGFYMMATLAFNELKTEEQHQLTFVGLPLLQTLNTLSVTFISQDLVGKNHHSQLKQFYFKSILVVDLEQITVHWLTNF